MMPEFLATVSPDAIVRVAGTRWETRCKLTPYPHQVWGALRLVLDPQGILPGVFGLFDDVGVGKTKQVIDAAHILFHLGLIDRVVVVAPGDLRSIWAHRHPALGEVAKHVWRDTDNVISQFHQESRDLSHGPGALHWTITNYEYLRYGGKVVKRKGYVPGPHLETLMRQLAATRHKTLLVFDEAWNLKTHNSSQTRAARALRHVSRRRIILTGTPIADTPMDLFAQMEVLDPQILGFRNFYAFRAKFAVMGGWQRKQIIKYNNLERLQDLIAPYVIRREKAILGLPPTHDEDVEVRLTPETWDVYRSMRNDLVAELADGAKSLAPVAVVKLLRLSQITNGLLGGLVNVKVNPADPWGEPILDREPARRISSEKLDAVTALIRRDQHDKAIVWGDYRVEVEDVADHLLREFPHHKVHKFYGDQSDEERDAAKLTLAPGGDPSPALVAGNEAAGGAGYNFAAAHVAYYLSPSFNLKNRLQSRGRLDRPGQTQSVLYRNLIAVGPNGQKTIDHYKRAAYKDKEDVATWTCAAWRQKLMQE